MTKNHNPSDYVPAGGTKLPSPIMDTPVDYAPGLPDGFVEEVQEAPQEAETEADGGVTGGEPSEANTEQSEPSEDNTV